MTESQAGEPVVSMTLAQRAQAGLLALAEAASQQRSDDERRAVQAACERAEKATNALAEIARIADDLRVRGLTVMLPPFARGKHLANLRRTATQIVNGEVSDDLANRLKGPAIQDALKSAESLIKSRENVLRSVAEAERTRIDADGQKPIPSLPGRESLQTQAKNARAALARRGPLAVADLPEAVDRWRRAAEDLRVAAAETEQALTVLPIDIREFIAAAVSESGADWSLLTPAVRAWLDTDGNGDGYWVRKW
jgi:hypothetical protein